MRAFKKYIAVLFLVAAFPLVGFIAKNFVLEASNEIYSYIPQESDFVIEINSRNFISELAYQRIFEEEYFMAKVYPGEEDERESKVMPTGFNPFGKIILFREQWANESIWFALLNYESKTDVDRFLQEKYPNLPYEFSEKIVAIQISSALNQDKLDEHLKKISRKEVKGFTERVDLKEIFNPHKEINCYIIPANVEHSQLLDGYLSFDFLPDHIRIEGAFTPLSSFLEQEPIAYALNKDEAFSMRSSLNLFNSIHLFNQEKLDNIPEYKQLVFDYNGVDCKLIEDKSAYPVPFKSIPHVDIHFDITGKEKWYSFFDSLQINEEIFIDSANSTLLTPLGAVFQYTLTDEIFELKQHPITLTPSSEENLYFDLNIQMENLINNTVFSVDENNPGANSDALTLMVARSVLGEMKDLASMDRIQFQLTSSDNGEKINANGSVEMKEKNGQSMVESFSFSVLVFQFISNYE